MTLRTALLQVALNGQRTEPHIRALRRSSPPPGVTPSPPAPGSSTSTRATTTASPRSTRRPPPPRSAPSAPHVLYPAVADHVGADRPRPGAPARADRRVDRAARPGHRRPGEEGISSCAATCSRAASALRLGCWSWLTPSASSPPISPSLHARPGRAARRGCRDGCRARGRDGGGLAAAGITLPQVHHGDGIASWAVSERGLRRGHGFRTGLEDVLVSRWSACADNAALVTAAVALMRAAGVEPDLAPLRPPRPS